MGLGERRQKGTRARTCFTPSKKFNLLIFYFLFFYKFSMGGLRGGTQAEGNMQSKGNKGTHLFYSERLIYFRQRHVIGGHLNLLSIIFPLLLFVCLQGVSKN